MKKNRRSLLTRLLIELGIYGALVLAYLWIVLRVLTDFLTQLAGSTPVLYAVLALALIVTQGLLLEMVTTFLLERLRLE